MQISVYIESAGGVAPNFPGSFLRVRQHSKNLPISAAPTIVWAGMEIALSAPACNAHQKSMQASDLTISRLEITHLKLKDA
jgi:hypothetical protein